MYTFEIPVPVNGESGTCGGDGMGTYGTHSTRFHDISNQQLFGLYRYENWNCMNEEEKLDLVNILKDKEAGEDDINPFPAYLDI